MLAGYERAVPIVLTLSLRAVKVLISKFDLTWTLWQGRIVYCCWYLLNHSYTFFCSVGSKHPKGGGSRTIEQSTHDSTQL